MMTLHKERAADLFANHSLAVVSAGPAAAQLLLMAAQPAMLAHMQDVSQRHIAAHADRDVGV